MCTTSSTPSAGAWGVQESLPNQLDCVLELGEGFCHQDWDQPEKRWSALFRSGMRSCPKFTEVLFTGEGWMEREIDRWFGAASEVIQILRSSVVVKKELSQKSKLWEVTERMRWQMQTEKWASWRSGWMPPGCLAVDMFRPYATEKRPSWRPRTWWRDNVS